MIVIRPRREEDDQQIVAIASAVYPDMEMTIERYRHHLATIQRNPTGYVERHVAEDNGRIVGTMTLERQPWLGRPGSFYAEILVDPTQRARGIGSRLNDTLETRARAVEAARMYALIQEGKEHVQRVVEAHGYRSTGRVDRMSRLPVDRANLDGYAWIYTGNDVENTRMLSINTRLGYEPRPGMVLVVKEMEERSSE